MKTPKLLFLFISLHAAFMGCSKKDRVAPICYIDTYTYVDGSYSTVTSYTYKDNKVITKSTSNSVGGTGIYNYSYDAHGRITSISSSVTNVGTTSSGNNIYTYDANGRMIQILSSGGGKTTFSYNSSNQMVTADYYTNNGSTFILYYSCDFIYPSTATKNYSTQMNYDGSNMLQNTVYYEYDTKQNPEALLFPADTRPTNNVTQITTRYPASSTPSVVTFTYTYNASGFPLSIAGKDAGNMTTYVYTNCN
jgi:YD repeat-containing protein